MDNDVKKVLVSVLTVLDQMAQQNHDIGLIALSVLPAAERTQRVHDITQFRDGLQRRVRHMLDEVENS